MPLKANQIVLIILSAVAIFLYWQNYQETFKNEGRLQISKQADAVVLTWQSDIDIPMAKRFEEAFNAWSDKTDKFVINLNSRGGALREGRLVIELIEQMKKTHLIETNVESGAFCLSMCVPIYLRGEIRSASVNSAWMFHQPTAYDFITGDEVSTNKDRLIAGERFIKKYFADSDMNQEWLNRLKQKWIGKDVWYSGQQLLDENSNVIQRIY